MSGGRLFSSITLNIKTLRTFCHPSRAPYYTSPDSAPSSSRSERVGKSFPLLTSATLPEALPRHPPGAQKQLRRTLVGHLRGANFGNKVAIIHARYFLDLLLWKLVFRPKHLDSLACKRGLPEQLELPVECLRRTGKAVHGSHQTCSTLRRSRTRNLSPLRALLETSPRGAQLPCKRMLKGIQESWQAI